ncbi:hypothetical protein HHK36_033210 [Tetracentron sinense]|uniref:Uncharacterized protein n=1 Tax=Tetracentron sinense TaxID=13715 RepID=A0A834Y9R4_TETSI|nr:hypothetical protein HHK36_033210 [Tetracentron sinense]
MENPRAASALENGSSSRPPDPPTLSYADAARNFAKVPNTSSPNIPFKNQSLHQGEPAIFFTEDETSILSIPHRLSLVAKCAYGRPPLAAIKKFMKKSIGVRLSFSIVTKDHEDAKERNFNQVWKVKNNRKASNSNQSPNGDQEVEAKEKDPMNIRPDVERIDLEKISEGKLDSGTEDADKDNNNTRQWVMQVFNSVDPCDPGPIAPIMSNDNNAKAATVRDNGLLVQSSLLADSSKTADMISLHSANNIPSLVLGPSSTIMPIEINAKVATFQEDGFLVQSSLLADSSKSADTMSLLNAKDIPSLVPGIADGPGLQSYSSYFPSSSSARLRNEALSTEWSCYTLHQRIG